MWKVFGINICGETIVILVILLILSVWDIRKRQLPTVLLLALTGMAAVWQFLADKMPAAECLMGVTLGIIFLGISRLTREAIGYGDSLLILALGTALGIWNVFYVLTAAFGVSAIIAIIKLCQHKMHRKESFPFVPCLLAGYLFYLICG